MPNRWRQRSAPRLRHQDHDHCQFVEPRRNARCQPFLQSHSVPPTHQPSVRNKVQTLVQHKIRNFKAALGGVLQVWKDSKVRGGVERAKEEASRSQSRACD